MSFRKSYSTTRPKLSTNLWCWRHPAHWKKMGQIFSETAMVIGHLELKLWRFFIHVKTFSHYYIPFNDILFLTSTQKISQDMEYKFPTIRQRIFSIALTTKYLLFEQKFVIWSITDSSENNKLIRINHLNWPTLNNKITLPRRCRVREHICKFTYIGRIYGW